MLGSVGFDGLFGLVDLLASRVELTECFGSVRDDCRCILMSMEWLLMALLTRDGRREEAMKVRARRDLSRLA